MRDIRIDGVKGMVHGGSRLQSAFRIETRSWIITEEMADLVNTGPPHGPISDGDSFHSPHLSGSDCIPPSLAAVVRIAPNILLDHLNHAKRANRMPLPLLSGCLLPLSQLFPPSVKYKPDIYMQKFPHLSSTLSSGARIIHQSRADLEGETTG